MNKMSSKPSWVAQFFQSTFGQKILILFAPFILMPEGDAGKTPSFEKVFAHLRLQAGAPFLGALFLSGALTVLLKTLKKKGFNLLWLIDVESLQVLFLLTGVLVILTYSFSLAKFMAPRILSLLKGNYPQFSLLFWTTHHGGLLMVSGFFCWLLTFLIWFRVSLWISLAVFLALVGLSLLVRFEIKRQGERLYQSLDFKARGTLRMVEGVFFGLAGIPLTILFLMHSPF